MFFIIGYKTCFFNVFYSHIDVFYNYGLYVVPFLGYSASKNGVTSKLGYGSFKVIENGAVR